jgi:hypothetical protein
LPPAENRIGAQRIEPSDKPDVATLLSQSQGGAERSPCFGRVAALLDRFFDMRLELFVDLAAQTIAAKYIYNA